MNRDPMPNEESFAKNEVLRPNSSSLEKIVDSLEFLINIQVERDETELKTLESIEAELVDLRKTVTGLQYNQQKSLQDNVSSGYAESKKNILAEHGMPDEQDDETKRQSDQNDSITADSEEMVESRLHMQIDADAMDIPMSEHDAKEVAKLKDELRQKLREAEVELSIGRAKLSQQKAKCEEREAQLGKAQRRLKNEIGIGDDDSDKRLGILARLKQQLKGIKKDGSPELVEPETRQPLDSEDELIQNLLDVDE